MLGKRLEVALKVAKRKFVRKFGYVWACRWERYMRPDYRGVLTEWYHWKPEWIERELRRMRKTGTRCSRYCCGNRRRYEGKTRQELSNKMEGGDTEWLNVERAIRREPRKVSSVT